LHRQASEWVECVFTSHGGGALRYEGTILKVTEPLASLWNISHKKTLAFYLLWLQLYIKGRDAITQMDTKTPMYGCHFIGQILSAAEHTLYAINFAF